MNKLIVKFMLFSKKLPILFKNKQKKRKSIIFNFFKEKKKFFKLKSLNNYRLFINNIKLINFFLRKSVSRFRRESRKEYYKRLKIKGAKNKFRIKTFKKLLKRFSGKILFKNIWYLQKQKCFFFLNRYRKIHNTYICFNSFKLPFSRKSSNSRMGKGKGKIKNWFIQIFSGKTIFYLKRWYSYSSIFALYLLKMYIPGKNILLTPSIKKNNSFLINSIFLICVFL